MNRALSLAIAMITILYGVTGASAAAVKPGDVITKENAGEVAGLLSPGNYVLARQGMEMKIVPTRDYDWPPPYKSSTEQYSPQVRLGPNGELQNYRGGLPFLVLDPNDPKVAQKIMWNFEFGPSYTDDLDSQDDEIASYAPGRSEPWSVYPVGHLAVYRNVGREEVAPITTDDEGSGIMQRVALGADYRPDRAAVLAAPVGFYGALPLLGPAASGSRLVGTIQLGMVERGPSGHGADELSGRDLVLR